MHVTRRSRALSGLLAVMALAFVVVGAIPARADDPPPPPGELTGTGSVAGTEIVQDETFTGSLCFEATKSIFGLRGVGTYHGRTASGPDVVYQTSLSSGQTLYGDGPIHLEVENTQTYYHGPFGTHGTSDASCSPATAGSPVPAKFRLFATDHVYRLDGSNNQVPCTGTGTFERGNASNPNDTTHWYAEWNLDADCTVVGNASGTPGTGVAPSGTAMTDTGVHDACFNPPCLDNIRVDYKQYLPYKGLHLGLSGPSAATVGGAVTLTAAVTNDGQPVANALVNFSVAGPAPSAPPAGAAATASDGRASFTFTAASAGDYTVTGSVTSGTATASGNALVHFDPATTPTMTLTGPTRAQTEQPVPLVATFVSGGHPVAGVTVTFAVTGAGTPTPASGTALTDANGQAAFSFTGNRAGDYTVTASASLAGMAASASRTVPLDINSLYRVGSTQLSDPSAVPPDMPNPMASVIDPAGRYAYFASSSTSSTKAEVVKVDLATFSRVAAVTPPTAVSTAYIDSFVSDPNGRYAYVASSNAVYRLDLSTFQWAGSLTLDTPRQFGHGLNAAAIDPAGRYAYFTDHGHYDEFASDPSTNYPTQVLKVDLATFQIVATLNLAQGEEIPVQALMDPAGGFAYFTVSSSGSTGVAEIVKVDLSTFQRVGSMGFDGSVEGTPGAALIDPTGNFAYVGTVSSPGRIIKVDVRTLQRIGTITLNQDVGTLGPYPVDRSEAYLYSAVMDPLGRYAYFATGGDPGGPHPADPRVPARVIRIDLGTFQRAASIDLPADVENSPRTAVMAPNGDYAYFGAENEAGSDPTRYSTLLAPLPGLAVKVAVRRPPVAWLTAGNDSYTTPYGAALSVPAPGVLANDADTQDADALGANLVTNPAHGTVSLNRNGSFTYTAADGFSGADTFTYQVDDGMNYSAPATVTVTVGAPPDGVQAVSGSAFGFETDVSLFGGPATVKGGPGSTCGQAGQPACADGESPAVSLPAGGGSLSATDPDGNLGQYGPAYIFENHGPLTVSAQGSTGPTGSVTASAAVDKVEDNDPFHAGSPDGQVSSTCSAGLSGFSGSARIVNGYLVLHTDPTTGAPTSTVTFDHTWDPAPNTTYDGALDHVGDRWRIVFNEQVVSPDAITVNAVHMYLLGPTAVGDMIIGASHCGITQAAPDTAPVANADAFTATSGRALTIAGPGVLANDTDADNQALRSSTLAPVAPPASGGGGWTFPSDPAHGTLRLGVDGSFTYTSTPGFTGTDTFTYLAQDARGRSSSPATVTVTVNPAPPKSVADFDGDGRTDRSVFRSGAWYADGQPPAYFGLSGDVAVPGDYDGDGKTDHAVYRGGAWLVEGQPTVWLGAPDDIPVPGDYDGDGKTDRAVFRPSSGAWFIDGQPTVYLGAPGDIAVPGDYDGDGRTDVAVWRPSSGGWFVNGQLTTYLGLQGDVPVPGDYDANGTTDRAVWRPGSGGWFVDGQPTTYLGLSGDVPVPGDYDANRSTDRAVWRPGAGGWYVDGQPTVYLGADGDQPLPLPPAARRSMAG